MCMRVTSSCSRISHFRSSQSVHRNIVQILLRPFPALASAGVLEAEQLEICSPGCLEMHSTASPHGVVIGVKKGVWKETNVTLASLCRSCGGAKDFRFHWGFINDLCTLFL